MSYGKSENARLGSGSDSDEEILIQKPKSKGKKSEPKGKKTPEKKSYRCDRCNFSSSSKAKYTKHAKSAHSGTIVQCDHCEFKTPYKWNLDRHYKNHLGGGALCCHLCNFSCDIKQSLTVHLQNHHSNVPEEIIESVKRQQIPPRNQSINNPLLNNNNSSSNGNTTSNASSNAIINNNNSDSNSSSGGGGVALSEAEKKVPPLRISRSLTGLSLGDDNNSCSSNGGIGGKKEDESIAIPLVVPPPDAALLLSAGNLSGNDSTCSSSDEKRNVRNCDLCDFEVSGDGSSSLMKKHLISQHGVHHKNGKHHHHHKRARTPSSSPEHVSTNNKTSPSPNHLPVVPIALPPKKSKGSTSPRPGQSASSTSNSPAIHRSQSPLKASEAISAYGSCDHNNLQAVAPSSDEERPHHQSILNLVQSHHGQLQISGEESAFTPVLGSDFSSHALSSLKKPKHRALAQFYQKIKPKFTTDTESPITDEIPSTKVAVTPTVAEPLKIEEEDGQKNSSVCSSKSNRCQYCRQRCKSTVDLAAHLEKCTDAPGIVTKKDGEEGGESCDLSVKKEAGEASILKPATLKLAERVSPVEETEESKVQTVNGSTGEINDDLIGFETAPGVGAIHTGKMDEMEYQEYLRGKETTVPEDETETNENRTNEVEEDEEEIEDVGGSGVTKVTGKGGKAVTSRKVYRCPENDCSFWATTASRFHVHIVGHYNLKPFECSECHYKSNWRWDVNKHIRLKTPKDPKHASAKTLLTHESGQRDYRKYDNYLVSMSLTHSANAKAPDCSTVANKRTKGGTVSTPKSSPELQQPSSVGSAKESPVNSTSNADISTNSPATVTPVKQRSPKYAKALAASSSPPTTSAIPFEHTHEEITAFEYHPSQNHTSALQQRGQHPEQHQDDAHVYPVDFGAAARARSPGEGRTFVETRMLAGGEIYQQASLLKQDTGMSSANNDGEKERGEGGDIPPNGFDLTLKRPHSRHAHHQQEEMRGEDVQDMKPTAAAVVTAPPTKKSRLKQIHHQQQQEHQKQLEQQKAADEASGAINEVGNKSLSMWQCIKCSFQHPNKELVSSHIRDQHKPKKGDTVSLLAHNHLIQVMIPEQDVEAMMTSTNVVEGPEYAGSAAASITPAQKKEIYQQMYHENGKVLSCKFCPYSTGLLYEMEIHADHHLNKSNSYYSCPHCSYSVAVKSELQEHLRLHGGDILPEIQNRLINSSTTISPSTARISMPSPTSTTENLSLSNKSDVSGNKNKYHCAECPYAANDHSEFQYHKQCHEPHDYPFKCHRCSFNVSVKFHLLQHLRVHGIQIDEVGIPQQQLPTSDQYPPEPVYEDVSNDYSPGPAAIQDEPLNLSIMADRKPVVIWENGVPMEGYKCSVCTQVFRDLNDLKEHEFTNNHRSSTTSNNSGSGNNANDCSAVASRQCDSPPCEAMNLSYKPVEHSSNKKSSQSHSKVNNGSSGKRSVTSAPTIIIPPQESRTVPMSSPSPSSSVHSAELGSSCSSKGEKEYLYLCDECPARFFFEKELKIHHTFHENKSVFQCPKCTYSARQKDPHLMSHMRVHGSAYQEKTKALLVKFPRAKVNMNSSSNAAASAAAAAAAAALSAASLINSSILNPNFNFQTAAAMLTASASGKFKPDVSAFAYPGDQTGFESLKKNGLSIICPKCPEKFYSTQAFQQHYEMHNSSGRADYRCKFCDYCAESRKSLAIHEIVHTGSELNLESGALAGKLLTSPGTAFNPVSMMAMVAHQDSPFASTAHNAAIGGNVGVETDNPEKNNIPVPEEAFEGNPDFVYPTYMKNGRVKSKRYKCIKCPSAFEKKDQYHTHIGLHGSNQKYKCTVCDYAVTYYANYIQHLKKHENQRNIPNDLLALGRKRHQVDEEINGGTLAKIAKISENGDASSNSSLESLENHHHSNGLNHVNSLMKCSYCPFQCFDEPTLQSHLVHHQDNPNWLHVCNICTFRTSSKKSLKEHARLHLLNNFHLQQQQQQQQQPPQHLHQNGNGHHHHDRRSNGEYVNGYDEEHHRLQQNDKQQDRQRNQYVEHEESSNGSM